MRWASHIILSCAAALLLAGSAYAQDATRARLITVPDAQMLSDHFPPVALVTAVSGRVELACDVAVSGDSECRAVEEAPAAMGFGAAAEAVARDWRFSPRIENGVAIASQVRIPIEFNNENTEPFVMERQLVVDAVRGNAPATDSETDLTSDQMDVIVCRWAKRSRCAQHEFPSSERARDTNSRFFPPTANTRGRALIACAIRSDGTPACVTERESPENMGFGEAALSLVLHVLDGRSDTLEPGLAFRVPVDFPLRDVRRRPRSSWMWEQVPTGSTFARYYPQSAGNRGVDGMVILVCAIRDDRKLNCAVRSQLPEDEGFGAAAVSISADFRLSEGALGLPGLAVGDRIELPIGFIMR